MHTYYRKSTANFLKIEPPQELLNNHLSKVFSLRRESLVYPCQVGVFMPNLASMFWMNYHSHSHYCDEIGTLEEQVTAARQQKVRAFGFSSHSPMPFDNAWSMRPARLESYLTETRRLKEKYKDSIELYTGLEVDFIPGCCGPSTHRNHLWITPLDRRITSA